MRSRPVYLSELYPDPPWLNIDLGIYIHLLASPLGISEYNVKILNADLEGLQDEGFEIFVDVGAAGIFLEGDAVDEVGSEGGRLEDVERRLHAEDALDVLRHVRRRRRRQRHQTDARQQLAQLT